MNDYLIKKREQLMDKADRALDAAWPQRRGTLYKQTLLQVADDLQSLVRQMQTDGVKPLELSRTYRCLGCVFTDLAPAIGKVMLRKAEQVYQKAEQMLQGQADEAEWARLNFNFGNTLRQLYPTDVKQLLDAQRRILSARRIFTASLPQYLPQVDEVLPAIRNLLAIAPAANCQAASRHKQMAQSGAMNAFMNSNSDQAQSPGENPEREMMVDMFQRFSKDLDQQADSSLCEAGRSNISLADYDDDAAEEVSELLAQSGFFREVATDLLEMQHYPQYGLVRPPEGSRSAELVELLWKIRRYLVEEINQPYRPPGERKKTLDLNVEASRLDLRIYATGATGATAVAGATAAAGVAGATAAAGAIAAAGVAGVEEDYVGQLERDWLRPFFNLVRKFSGRMLTMLVRPGWSTEPFKEDTNSVFYSGSEEFLPDLTHLCETLNLEAMPYPVGEDLAAARWRQLRRAMLSVFDFRVPAGSPLAQVAYELGMALSLGKPIVVIAQPDQVLPCKLTLEPVRLPRGGRDFAALGQALDHALVWLYPRGAREGYLKTARHMLLVCEPETKNTFVDHTLKLIARQLADPDPLEINRSLVQLLTFRQAEHELLIAPCWEPEYPVPGHDRFLHVMPSGVVWAEQTAAAVQAACVETEAEYILEGGVLHSHAVRSLWEEITRANHILLDLTGLVVDAALALGMSRVLGRHYLVVGQPGTDARLFPLIKNLQVQIYHDPGELRELVIGFLSRRSTDSGPVEL